MSPRRGEPEGRRDRCNQRAPGRRPTFTKSSISGSLSSPLAVAGSIMPSAPGASVPGRGEATSAVPGASASALLPCGALLESGACYYSYYFHIYFPSREQRCLRDQCPERSHAKEGSQRRQGARGKGGFRDGSRSPGATSAGLQGGVTGSALVSYPRVAANEPKIA